MKLKWELFETNDGSCTAVARVVNYTVNMLTKEGKLTDVTKKYLKDLIKTEYAITVEEDTNPFLMARGLCHGNPLHLMYFNNTSKDSVARLKNHYHSIETKKGLEWSEKDYVESAAKNYMEEHDDSIVRRKANVAMFTVTAGTGKTNKSVEQLAQEHEEKLKQMCETIKDGIEVKKEAGGKISVTLDCSGPCLQQ